MKTQAPQPAKTSAIPNVSNNICIGDLYCSNAHPMANKKKNRTVARIIMAGMIIMNLTQLLAIDVKLSICPCRPTLLAIGYGNEATL